MPSPPHLHWRLLLTPPAPGAFNMALDEALMSRARRTGEWVFRVYGWTPAALSLGRNQTARGAYDTARIHRLGLDVVRRPTGGRAIHHAEEVTYSVTAPEEAAGGLGDAYRRINRVLQRGLSALGIPVVVASGARSLTPGLAPCFDLPAGGELVAAGRKLAGSAQWRHREAILQHGSIISAGDQAMVSALLLDPRDPPPPPATLQEFLGRQPALPEVAECLFHAVRELEDPAASPLSLEPQVLAEAEALESKYRDDAWTWRR
jgi:lipoyl(octanoyl) transferase